MTRHRDAADARRRERRRAAHPVQVTAGSGVVQVWTGAGISRESTDLTPTEARALAGVLEAVAADVETREGMAASVRAGCDACGWPLSCEMVRSGDCGCDRSDEQSYYRRHGFDRRDKARS